MKSIHWTRTKVQTIVGVIAYLVWALFAYTDKDVRPDFLKFHIGIVIGVVGLILRDMPPKPLPTPPPKEPFQ